MVKWTEYVEDKEIRLETELHGKSWEAVAAELVDAFVDILTRIGQLKPKSWNRIYIELWADSGRMIVYPHKRGKSRSDRQLSVDLEITLFQAEHDKLPNEEEEPDNFESHYGALMAKIGLALDEALEDKRVKKLISKLAENTDFTVWLQDADDPDAIGQLYVL